ncbi:NADPH-dependent F420 reductase [Mycolicibacterium hodleri]|uniref:NADP oxidoreductase n=1 Tax=Mycolicibacterium hodleri TaxID=49897 RepID=A0A502EFD9_9MYCO|nr:NAD(P)-binding domain-containing protein [Mycolicibacterium hodleri]TPG35061.1 NADP oxidoreductase [Mycolicibacterium hodleri]
MTDTIGIIGSGSVAQALATHALGAGYSVLLSNSRGPASLTDTVTRLGEGARAVTVQDAATAGLIIVAVPFVKVPDLAESIPDWSGRVVIDVSNQFAQYQPTYSGFVDLGEETGSEWVARHLPGATVVKAFNTLYASHIAADPRHPEGRQIVFYAGDDDSARDQVATFAERLGFAPVAVGGLRDGGRLMQLGGSLSGVHALRQD